MYPTLVNSSLRKLESLFLYDIKKDERYELDRDSFELLSYFTRGNEIWEIIKKLDADEKEAEKVLNYLGRKKCVLKSNKRSKNAKKKFAVKQAFLPSLRYLQLHITEKCNLNCRHCYLGDKGNAELPFSLAKKALDEFSEFGLKVLITGGEPMLHSKFWEIIEYAGSLPVRIELLTNGTFLSEKNAERLAKHINGVQISLDGLKEGHEFMRGRKTFEKATSAIKNAKKSGLAVSCATMIHAKNFNEFPMLKKLVEELNADEWLLDIISPKGNAEENEKIFLEEKKAAEIFKNYGFSFGVHEGDENYSCGSHLCSVSPKGEVTRCGFFDESAGNIKKLSLEECWRKIAANYIPKIETLECKACKFLHWCRGGCRYRALEEGSFYARDSFMCQVFSA